MPRHHRYLAPLAAVGLVLTSCGSDDPAIPTSGSDVAGDVTVFAAASLTAAFTEIGAAFEAEYPEAAVVLNFAGSSDLVAQILQSAPADVFASADASNMDRLVGASGHATEPGVFATNVAEIIVQPGNPLGITGVVDLANDDLIVVQCAPEVPCGRYAAEIYANAEVAVVPKSYEENVNAVVTKVRLGEADAGIVYATDVVGAGDAAQGVAIPADVNVIAEYPIAAVADAPNLVGAQAFVDFVLGAEGQSILATHGFRTP